MYNKLVGVLFAPQIFCNIPLNQTPVANSTDWLKLWLKCSDINKGFLCEVWVGAFQGNMSTVRFFSSWHTMRKLLSDYMSPTDLACHRRKSVWVLSGSRAIRSVLIHRGRPPLAQPFRRRHASQVEQLMRTAWAGKVGWLRAKCRFFAVQGLHMDVTTKSETPFQPQQSAR